ncbi:MAG: hypothetical protein MHMPM18_000417 [Marteilia pararefringens]
MCVKIQILLGKYIGKRWISIRYVRNLLRVSRESLISRRGAKRSLVAKFSSLTAPKAPVQGFARPYEHHSALTYSQGEEGADEPALMHHFFPKRDAEAPLGNFKQSSLIDVHSSNK